MKFTRSLIKVVLLIQYSKKKRNCRKIKLTLNLENWHQNFKSAIFWQTSIKDIKRSFEDVCLKSLLNFNWYTMKFNNCHHTNRQSYHEENLSQTMGFWSSRRSRVCRHRIESEGSRTRTNLQVWTWSILTWRNGHNTFSFVGLPVWR